MWWSSPGSADDSSAGRRDQMPFTGSREQQAKETVRSAAPHARPGVPSWGPVLATTFRLWAARRRQRLRRSRRPWLVAICVLAVGAVAVIAVVQLTGTSSGQAARVPTSGRAGQSPLTRGGSGRSSGAAAAVRAPAAAWVADQAGGDESIACD